MADFQYGNPPFVRSYSDTNFQATPQLHSSRRTIGQAESGYSDQYPAIIRASGVAKSHAYTEALRLKLQEIL